MLTALYAFLAVLYTALAFFTDTTFGLVCDVTAAISFGICWVLRVTE